jgi:hypothetical protein
MSGSNIMLVKLDFLLMLAVIVIIQTEKTLFTLLDSHFRIYQL